MSDGSARCLFDGVNIDVQEGIAAITGENGVGKTTLLKVIAGQLPCQVGDISVVGHRVTSAPSHLRGIFMIHQQPKQNIVASLTVSELLGALHEVTTKPLSLPSNRIERNGEVAASDRLARACLPLLSRTGEQLSLGESQRVALLLASLSGKPVILADEPTASLDATAQRETLTLLKEISQYRCRWGIYFTQVAPSCSR